MVRTTDVDDADSGPALTVEVLGPLQARRAGEIIPVRGPVVQRALAVLSTEPGRVITSAALVEQLWPDSDGDNRQALQVAVAHLRRALGSDAIVTEGPGYLLRARCDADQFERTVIDAERTAPTDIEQAALQAATAKRLWRGAEAYAGLWDVPALARRGIDLADIAQRAQILIAEAAIRAGQPDEHLPFLRDLVACQQRVPERHLELLMSALAVSGRRAEALEVCDRFEHRLVEQSGLNVSVSIAALRARIDAGEPVVPQNATAMRAGDRCPYMGLRSYGEEHAELFHGRAELVERLLLRSETSLFTVLIGRSGSGKTSLLHAGLLPALRTGGRVCALMRPGDRPAVMLDGTLDSVGAGPVTLLVDQFEETFSLCRDDSERAAFLRRLTSLGDNVHVIVSFRADYHGHCHDHATLSQLVEANTVICRPLTRQELRQAIVAPATACGLTVETGLLDELLAHADNPSLLPHLSHLLTELWLRRDRGSGTLTLAAFTGLGGLAGALAAQAEQALHGLSAGQLAATRELLLRLVEPGDGAPDARRRQPVNQLLASVADPEETLSMLQLLVDRRLVVVDEDRAELAHDVLLSHDGWPSLRRWLDESGAELRAVRDLERDAAQWLRRDQDRAYLWSGSRLRAARELSGDRAAALTGTAARFLEASATRERAGRQTRRAALAAVTAGAVAMVTLAVIGTRAWLRQRDENAARSFAAASLFPDGWRDGRMSARPVSAALYAQCARFACEQPAVADTDDLGDRPVVRVRLAQAEQFCSWIGHRVPGRDDYEAEIGAGSLVLYDLQEWTATPAEQQDVHILDVFNGQVGWSSAAVTNVESSLTFRCV